MAEETTSGGEFVEIEERIQLLDPFSSQSDFTESKDTHSKRQTPQSGEGIQRWCSSSWVLLSLVDGSGHLDFHSE